MINFPDHTHNLNILIVDENNITIDDKILLENIYNEFVNKNIIKKCKKSNTIYEIHLYWERLPLTVVQSKFMGELFIESLHSDKVLYETTNKILSEIENKLKINTTNKNWKIIFHISALLEENK
jgi:hypothetical protein